MPVEREIIDRLAKIETCSAVSAEKLDTLTKSMDEVKVELRKERVCPAVCHELVATQGMRITSLERVVYSACTVVGIGFMTALIYYIGWGRLNL